MAAGKDEIEGGGEGEGGKYLEGGSEGGVHVLGRCHLIKQYS